MIDPLENSGFKHELKFYDFGMDWYEIPDPIGFIGSKFVMKRDKGWSRDVNYFAIDSVEFPKQDGERLTTARVINPLGEASDYMDYGFEWLMANRALKGSEMKVGYRISAFGVVFREFEIDTKNEQLTNGIDWFRCKLIEIGKVADHKRNEKNIFNAYSDKSWKDETITPIESFNYLCKATPIESRSVFKMSGNYEFIRNNIIGTTSDIYGVNPSQLISESEINNTLGWVTPVNEIFELDNFGLILAVVNTQNIRIAIDVDFDYTMSMVYVGSTPPTTWGVASIELQMYIGTTVDSSTLVQTFVSKSSPVDGASQTGTVTESFTYQLDNLPVGQKIFIFYKVIIGVNRRVTMLFRKNDHKIEVIETELNLVIPAVLYPDLIKQSVKYVNDLPVLLGDFASGKRFYDQAVFNRSAVSGKKQMYATPELVMSQLEEVCADYEISQECIDIRQREGFYENYEIGSFLINPEDDYAEPFNEEYLINNFQFGYKKYEQEKTEKKTSKSLHTQSEFLPRNDRRTANKKIELNFVRDPKYKQTVFNVEVKSPTTSTDRDEDLFIEEMVSIPPNAINNFIRTLLMRWVDGKLEILNRNTLGTNEDAVLNWNSIGLTVAGDFQIISNVNIGNFTVFNIKDDGSILTLTPITAVTQFNGNGTINIQHNYTDVIWQTRTDEGFSISPKGFANLNRTIKRNIFEWYDYLATVLFYAKLDVKNSFFKNFNQYNALEPFDGRQTQLLIETTPVVENAPILYANLPNPIVEPILIKSGIHAPYLDVVNYLELYKTQKGFIRLHDGMDNVVFVYPKQFQYTLSSEKAEIQGEKKYISQNLRIDIVGDLVYVNDVAYNLRGTARWFIAKNDSIKLYDKKSTPLSNFYSYKFVFLNSVKYSSMEGLISALNVYQWT